MTSNMANIKKIVCFTTNPAAYAIRRLGEETTNNHLDYAAISVDDLTLVSDPDGKAILLNQGTALDFENTAVIVRSLGRKDRDAIPLNRTLLNYLFDHNVPILNGKMWSISSYADKLEEYHLLRQWGLPVPSPTYFFTNRKTALNFKDWQFPVVRKPRRGSHGVGVVKINDRSELEANLTDYPERYIWQHCIEADYDLRVFATKDTVIGAISRHNDKAFVNNVSAGGQAKAYDLDANTKNICLACCQKYEADIIGIDIMIDQRNQQPYILEVGQSNQFEGFEQATGVNVAAWHLKAFGLAKR